MDSFPAAIYQIHLSRRKSESKAWRNDSTEGVSKNGGKESLGLSRVRQTPCSAEAAGCRLKAGLVLEVTSTTCRSAAIACPNEQLETALDRDQKVLASRRRSWSGHSPQDSVQAELGLPFAGFLQRGTGDGSSLGSSRQAKRCCSSINLAHGRSISAALVSLRPTTSGCQRQPEPK